MNSQANYLHGAKGQKPDSERMRQLILYLRAALGEPDDRVLAYALFKCDFDAFTWFGRSLTGHQYVKGLRGVEPVGLATVLDGIVPGEEFTKGSFVSEEIERINSIADGLRNATPEDVSAELRESEGWQITEPNRPIPYTTALTRKPKLNDIQKRGIVRSLGLQ